MARSRAPIIEKMEETLCVWINDRASRRIPLEDYAIKQTAVNIYNHLRENGEYPVIPGFVASKNWLSCFMKRFSLRSIKSKRSTVDNEAETKTEELQKNSEQPGNREFNINETGLCKKKMPKKPEIFSPDYKIVRTQLNEGDMDSNNPQVKIKTEIESEDDTNADDMINVRIEDVRSVEDTIPDISAGPSTTQNTGGQLHHITKTSVPAEFINTVVEKPNLTTQIKTSYHKKISNNSESSTAATINATQYLPIVIKMEPVDEYEENAEPVQTHAEKRSQENAVDGSKPPPAKKKRNRKKGKGDAKKLEALPLNFQNSVLERLNTLSGNMEANTHAMSMLSKAVTDSSESNIRAMNNLANVISNIGSLIFSSLQNRSVQGGAGGQ